MVKILKGLKSQPSFVTLETLKGNTPQKQYILKQLSGIL